MDHDESRCLNQAWVQPLQCLIPCFGSLYEERLPCVFYADLRRF